jgi:hypothetical protein
MRNLRKIIDKFQNVADLQHIHSSPQSITIRLGPDDDDDDDDDWNEKKLRVPTELHPLHTAPSTQPLPTRAVIYWPCRNTCLFDV